MNRIGGTSNSTIRFQCILYRLMEEQVSEPSRLVTDPLVLEVAPKAEAQLEMFVLHPPPSPPALQPDRLQLLPFELVSTLHIYPSHLARNILRPMHSSKAQREISCQMALFVSSVTPERQISIVKKLTKGEIFPLKLHFFHKNLPRVQSNQQPSHIPTIM